LKIRKKLNKTSRNSKIAYTIALISIAYLLMTLVKGIYLWTDGSSFDLAVKANFGMAWIIQNTYFFPLNFIWEKIPSIPLEGGDIISFYKVIIPPMVVFVICSLFIVDHRSLKAKYYDLKDDIEKEIALRDMRKEAGIDTVSENATVDVVISNATNSDPSWHDTWWGRIAIGLSIVLIATAIGLK